MLRRTLILTLLAGCSADPLPQPPIDGTLLSLVETPQGTELRGSPGAVRDAARGDVRVTVPDAMVSATQPIAPDGSFSVALIGTTRSQAHFVELVDVDTDLFVAAYVGVPMSEAVVETDPGGDVDDDGSPDVIDCAPMDDTRLGDRCECVPGPDLCTGLDDDCDGFVDEDCTTCSFDSDCPMGQVCEAGSCVVR